MLLEVRVGGEKGAQTVFPGSVHESDEEIRWDENGEPAKVDDDDLLKRARLLACDLPVRALLAREKARAMMRRCPLAASWPASG